MSASEEIIMEQLRSLYAKTKKKAASMIETSKRWTVRLLMISVFFNLMGLLSLAYDPYQAYHVVEMNPPPWATRYGIIVGEEGQHGPPVITRLIPESGLILVPTELNASQVTLRIWYMGRLEDGAHVEKIIVTRYQLGPETRLGVSFTP